MLYKLDNLSVIPETHVKVEGENWLYKVVLDLHQCTVAFGCPPIPIQITDKITNRNDVLPSEYNVKILYYCVTLNKQFHLFGAQV